MLLVRNAIASPAKPIDRPIQISVRLIEIGGRRPTRKRQGPFRLNIERTIPRSTEPFLLGTTRLILKRPMLGLGPTLIEGERPWRHGEGLMQKDSERNAEKGKRSGAAMRERTIL